MKREFLKAIETLTDEQIDSIMAEHGKDIETWKQSNASLQKQLLDTQNALKAFDGVNVDELKGQISTLTQQMQAKADEYAKELADRDFMDSVKTIAMDYNPRKLQAVMSLMDMETLKASKNQEADIKAEFEKIKASDPYLFADVVVPRVTGRTDGLNPDASGRNQKANDALRAMFGKGTN